MMYLWVSYKKKIRRKNNFLTSLKSLKKGVGSGSGSVSERYGSADPDPHQNVTDPPTLTVMRIRFPAFMCCLYDWAGSWPTVWPAPSSAPLTILGGSIILKTTDVANKG